jgi:hypothetical protein
MTGFFGARSNSSFMGAALVLKERDILFKGGNE